MRMMNNRIYVAAVVAFSWALMLALAACGGQGDSCCAECDSMRVVLAEYVQRDSVKSALLTSYDNHLSKFGNIQDSIEMYNKAIDSLKVVIKSRGRASGSDNAELQKYMNQIRSLIAQNQELAEQLQQQGLKNASMDKLIKLMYSSVEAKQAELAETQRNINSLKKEVQGLENKVETLSTENETLSRKVEVLNDVAARIPGACKVVQPRERKAKKIQTLEISYTLEANMKSTPGTVPVYFRILDPLGKVLDPHGEFVFEGRSIAYTLKSFVDYKGKSVRQLIEWNKSHVVLEPGTYTVDFFIDNYKGTSDSFTLEK